MLDETGEGRTVVVKRELSLKEKISVHLYNKIPSSGEFQSPFEISIQPFIISTSAASSSFKSPLTHFLFKLVILDVLIVLSLLSLFLTNVASTAVLWLSGLYLFKLSIYSQ